MLDGGDASVAGADRTEGRGRIVRNIAALVIAQVVMKVVNIAVAVLMVRWLGVEALGEYAYILAFCFPFGAIADFGLATLATREISRDRTRAAAIVATTRRLVLTLSAVSIVVMLTVAAALGHDRGTMLGIALTAVSSLLAAGIAVNLAMLAFARTLAGPVERGVTPSGHARAMVIQALPVGLLMVAFALYYRVDMVMLRWLRGAEDVGVYAAAYRFIDAIALLAASIGGPFFPRLSSVVDRDPGAARALLEDVWRPLLALALPLSIGLALVADPLVVALFGADFAAAAGAVRILAGTVVPLFWVTIANHALIATDRIRTLAIVYTISLGLNVVLNVILIPPLGADGASLATVVAEWVNLALVVVVLRRAFGVTFAMASLWRYPVAAGVMALVVAALLPHQLAGAIVAGGLVYPVALLIAGYSRSADMSGLKRLLAR